jgi:major type 1 subunit fimbrin (pilin)
MNMKVSKTLFPAALIAGLSIAAIAPPSAHAADGTINFNGKVVANSCSIAVAGGTAATALSGTATGTVTLKPVFTSVLSTVGTADTADAAPFSLVYSGCDTNVATVQANFSAGNSPTPNNNLPSTGSATGVEVQLTNSTGTPINIATNAGSPVSATLSGGGTTLNYKAQYYPSAAVTAGLVTAKAIFTTIYQ